MLHNLLRICPRNIGDKVCSPCDYFDLGPVSKIEVGDITSDQLTSTIILGGGGVTIFDRAMQVLSSHASQIIAWGIGCNREPSYPPSTGVLPIWLQKCRLAGIRDYGTPFDWVPCASCMSPLFDAQYEVQNEVGLYEHWEHPLGIAALPALRNDCHSFAEAVAFLASCETIVTNSYHGAYWAVLLGRRVLVKDINSKLIHMKHQPAIYHSEPWHHKLGELRAFPEAISECRAANVAFYERVKDELR